MSTGMTGARIAEALRERRMTTAELAARVGVHQTTVERWLREINEPRAALLPAIAAALQVTVDWLVGAGG